MHFEESVELAAKVIDAVGVAVIVGGVVLATTLIARSGADWDQRFREYRRGVGRSILLGLEFLVAADIIRTVAVSPTFYGVGVLGIIVLIRTFLSFTLELEIDGRWPWQRQTAGRANDGNSQLVSVRELKPSDVAYVDRFLPLSRFTEETGEAGTASTYLVAWDGRDPVGHTHIAWTGTHLAIPEIQDVFVLPERRRQGIASQLTQAAEVEARKRGWDSISLSVSQEGNEFARRLYAKLGYVEAPTDPLRVSGVIVLRGQPIEVDDTLVYLMKRL